MVKLPVITSKIKIAIFLIFLVVSLQALVRYMLDNDSKRESIVLWLLRKQEVVSLVGEKEVAKLKEKISLQASPEKPSYEKYTFHIVGSRGAVLVSVIVNSRGSYELDKLVKLEKK
ncbi:hypothetical protein [Endozoicomonas acroporae]|uniref:hypothetical protein n=1 Tax=Endozoicomonas acroporae TaxID=1701104 RepID=UPI003D7925E5